MLRILFALVLGVTALTAAAGVAAEKKEVTLEGKITCAKCDLGEADKCATVIKVEKDVYFFDAKAHKKYHSDTCKAGKDGKVVGTVEEKDGKKIVTVTKLEYKK